MSEENADYTDGIYAYANEIARRCRIMRRRSKRNGIAQKRFLKNWKPLIYRCPKCREEFVQRDPEQTQCYRRRCQNEQERQEHIRRYKALPKCIDCGMPHCRELSHNFYRCMKCAEKHGATWYAASLMGGRVCDFSPEILKAKTVQLRALRALRKSKQKAQ